MARKPCSEMGEWAGPERGGAAGSTGHPQGLRAVADVGPAWKPLLRGLTLRWTPQPCHHKPHVRGSFSGLSRNSQPCHKSEHPILYVGSTSASTPIGTGLSLWGLNCSNMIKDRKGIFPGSAYAYARVWCGRVCLSSLPAASR